MTSCQYFNLSLPHTHTPRDILSLFFCHLQRKQSTTSCQYFNLSLPLTHTPRDNLSLFFCHLQRRQSTTSCHYFSLSFSYTHSQCQTRAMAYSGTTLLPHSSKQILNHTLSHGYSLLFSHPLFVTRESRSWYTLWLTDSIRISNFQKRLQQCDKFRISKQTNLRKGGKVVPYIP